MKKGRKLISGMLSGVLIISLALPVNATEVQEAQQKVDQLESQKETAEAEQNSLQAQVNELSGAIRQSTEDLAQKKEEIDVAEQELVNAKVEENEQYDSMKLRIKYMYEKGNINLIEVFMEAESFSDFVNKAEYIAQLTRYDREKLEEFQETVEQVKEKEEALQVEYEELAEIQDSLSAQKAEAETLLSQKSSELAAIEADLTQMQVQLQAAQEAERKRQEAIEAEAQRQAALKAQEEARLAAEKKAQEELKAQQASSSSSTSSSSSSSSSGSVSSSNSSSSSSVVVSGSGYFTHPCPGMSYQSSYFGEVRLGIGDTTPHKGHDYAASAGTPIYAAAAGTVVIAGYSYSAGYWVVINHGNGLVSKYMHMCEMPMVSAGSRVAKGQQIGKVGTTGQSTGNHLHFQVELNGVAVNPSNYM